MPRSARIVLPGVPHHVTQRGNRRERVFFEDGDQLRYLAFLQEGAVKAGTEIWAYCLMPNHVHVIALPSGVDGLRALFADAHRRYTAYINWRHNWTGHLWQGRFGSVAMDETHLAVAMRYIALNPVRAGLVERPQDWPWSSVRAQLAMEKDGIVQVDRVAALFPDFAGLIAPPERVKEFDALRKRESTGRPLGGPDWMARMADMAGRSLTAARRGPKPRR